jgi:DNA uptake protein ComE-like DNA-binding protein
VSNGSGVSKREWTPVPFSLDTVTTASLRAMGFSVRQAEVVLNYIEMKGGLRSAAEFAGCYVVSDEMFASLEPWLVFPEKSSPVSTEPTLVNLNSADSTTLRGVRGIGERTVMRIIDYRARLGGFVCPEQLAEVEGVTEENYARIVSQIFVDSCDILKIDINFAPAKVLGRHPYITDKTLRKLLKLRQLKGGWNNTGQLIEDKIVTSEEAAKLAPYLMFRQQVQ